MQTFWADYQSAVIHISIGQVREAIGVALSVLCSNIRLYRSFCMDLSSDGENNNMYGKCWVDYLSKRASELVVRIQSSARSSPMEDSIESHPNGHTTGDLKDDIKWMETVQFI